MEGVTRGNENGKGADLYQVKIHFDDGRSLVELLAEDFDICLEEKGSESGLREYSYTVPGGEQVPIYLDPGKVSAILPVPAVQWEQTPQPKSQAPDPDTPRKSARSNRREHILEWEGDEPAGGAGTERPEPSPGRRGVKARRSWNPPETLPAASMGIPRCSDLEREVLKFLSRFIAAEAGQLSNIYEIEKRLFERGQYRDARRRRR